MIKRCERADGADHNRHRMCVAAEAFEEAIKLRVQHRVIGDVFVEAFELGFVRQLTIGEKVANFEEAGFLSQLVDRIAAIEQHAFIAIDVGDLAFARSR